MAQTNEAAERPTCTECGHGVMAHVYRGSILAECHACRCQSFNNRSGRLLSASAERPTCTRLIGKAGERCRTCNRLIVRYEGRRAGAYSLQHAGPSIAERLAELNQRRAAR